MGRPRLKLQDSYNDGDALRGGDGRNRPRGFSKPARSIPSTDILAVNWVVMKFAKTYLLIAATVLMAACSSNATPTAQPTDIQPVVTIVQARVPTLTPDPAVAQVSQATATVPISTATPVPAKPIVVAVRGPVDSLHPLYARSDAAQTVLAALFVGCAGLDENNHPVALGCQQVPALDNGGAQFVGEGLDRYLELTFKIRAGWRWTDGKPVVAQDALYAWQLMMQPEAGLRDALTQKVFTMQAPDASTIVVHFMSAAQARAAATGDLSGDVAFEYFSQLGDYAQYAQQETPLVDANYWAVVRWLPAHILEAVAPKDQLTSTFAQTPVGDGAFEMSASDASHILLTPSTQPFPLGAPKITGLDLMFADSLQQLAGQYNVGWAEPLEISVVPTNTVVFDSPNTEQILLNVDRFPFNDVKVRQALANSLNRDALMQEMGSNIPLSAITPTLPYAPQRAAELLTEAGWNCSTKPCAKFNETEGVTQTLEFTLVTTERQPRNLLTQVIQKQLADVGFGMNIQIVYGLGKQSKLFAPYRQGGILLTRSFDAALYQQQDQGSLRGLFDCASVPTEEANDVGKGNASGFCDQTVDAVIKASDTSENVLSAQGQTKTYADALAAVESLAPVVRLYKPVQFVQVNGIAGVKPTATIPITWNAWEWAAGS